MFIIHYLKRARSFIYARESYYVMVATAATNRSIYTDKNQITGREAT